MSLSLIEPVAGFVVVGFAWLIYSAAKKFYPGTVAAH